MAESLGQVEAEMAENRIRGQARGEGKAGGIRCKTDDPGRVARKAWSLPLQNPPMTMLFTPMPAMTMLN